MAPCGKESDGSSFLVAVGVAEPWEPVLEERLESEHLSAHDVLLFACAPECQWLHVNWALTIRRHGILLLLAPLLP